MALAFGRAAKRTGVARGDLGLVRAGKNVQVALSQCEQRH
jgi:hypothetical protein